MPPAKLPRLTGGGEDSRETNLRIQTRKRPRPKARREHLDNLIQVAISAWIDAIWEFEFH